jgi:hypothetical protein
MRTLVLFLLLAFHSNGHSQSLMSKPLLNNLNKKIDATFYETGQIKIITFSIQQPIQSSVQVSRKLLKVFYQYDSCGNLRNTTNLYKAYINPNWYGILNPSPYQEENNILTNRICEEEWAKPILV